MHTWAHAQCVEGERSHSERVRQSKCPALLLNLQPAAVEGSGTVGGGRQKMMPAITTVQSSHEICCEDNEFTVTQIEASPDPVSKCKKKKKKSH